MDLKSEEKVIGGAVSLRQAAYVGFGVIIGALAYVALPFLSFDFRVGVFAFFVVIGGILGFAQIKGISMDMLVLYGVRYLMSPRKIKYERRKRLWEE